MLSPVWIGTGLGLAAGMLLSYGLGLAILPRWVGKSEHTRLLVRLAFAGTVVAFLPALLLSLVVGGPLGELWGERVFGLLGFPSGASIGLALGVALVFTLVLASGAAGGVLVGQAWLHYREGRP